MMTTIKAVVPTDLYDRMKVRAEESGLVIGEMAGFWLWEIERQKREHNERLETRGDAGPHNRCVSAGHDDGSAGCDRVADGEQGSDGA